MIFTTVTCTKYAFNNGVFCIVFDFCFVRLQGVLTEPVEWTGMVRAKLFVMSTGRVRLVCQALDKIRRTP